MGRTGLVVLALVSGLACDAKDPDDDMIADDHDDAEDGDDDPDDDEDDEDDEPVTQSEDDDMPDEPPPPPPAPRPDAAVPCDPSAWGGNVCTTADGAEGVSYCIVVDGEQLDTPCTTEPGECEPGDNQDYGCMGSICVWNGADFEYFSWSEPDCITPLVVQLDGETSFQPATATPFDMSSDGTCTQTDWPTAPWLALDRDGDGVITSGAELFGSATKMSTGGYASNGFAALAELDDNRDGRIDAQDAAFAKLVLWSDLDDDRMGTTAELRRIGDAHLVAIDLAFDRRASCDGNGNCGLERAAFEYQTAEGTTTIGEIVDVHLQCR